MPSLDKCSVLVVGSGTTMGPAIVEHLGAEGLALVLCEDNTAAGVAALRSMADTPHLTVTEDVSTAEGARAAVERALELGGSLEAVVLCCEPAEERSLARLDGSLWADSVESQLRRAFLVCQAAARAWTAAQRRGAVIVVAGGTSLLTADFGQAQQAALAGGVVGLVRAIGGELRHKSVAVNAVLWGRTPSSSPCDSTAAVAPVVAFLASQRASGVTGQVVVVEGQTLALTHIGRSGGAVATDESWTAADVGARWEEISR